MITGHRIGIGRRFFYRIILTGTVYGFSHTLPGNISYLAKICHKNQQSILVQIPLV